MTNATNPSDGQKVVIQNGQRVTGTMSESEAQAEAARRNRMVESGDKPASDHQRAQVKTNLCG